MAVYYTTPQKVAEYLNLTAFSATTIPTKQSVENLIMRVENSIDGTIMNSYRERQVYQEIHNLENKYYYGSGIPVHLLHRPVQSFDTTKGDKLEIWDGSSWVDWTSTKTNDRNGGDYHIDTTQGTLWILSQFAASRRYRIRITYRYGDYSSTTVTGIQNKGGTTLTVGSTAGFDQQGTIRLYMAGDTTQEIHYTGKTSTTFTGCVWGANNTTSADTVGGETVFQTSLDIEDLATKMVALELLRTNFRTNLVPISGELNINDIIRDLQADINQSLRENTQIQVIS